MAITLQTEYGVACDSPGTFTVDGFTAIIAENHQHEVSHIGFQLFSATLTENNPSPVYQFVERYLLELYLLKNNAEIQQKMTEEKVSLRLGNRTGNDIRKGLASYLPRMAHSNSLSITTDNSHYTVMWLEDGQVLCRLRFPIQYELLWGMNKKEIEPHFYTDLLYFQQTHASIPKELPSVRADELEKSGNNCYVWEGDWYALEAMNNNRFYRQNQDQTFSPLCSSSHPEESLQNLFTLECPVQLQSTVLQRLYGQKKNEFEVPLATLIAFCRNEGCEIFVGIEKREKTIVTGSVTLLNRALGYNHLLYFKADHRLLETPEQYPINLELYAYIPMHNLHNLYHDTPADKKSTKKYITKEQ